MKQTVFLLLLSSVVYCAKAQTDKEPYMVKSLSNESIKEVEARTSGGSISVNGGNASDARIEVYVTANNNQKLTKDEIKQRLDELYELNISTGANKLTAVAKSKEQIKDWKKALNIAYKIYVPQNVSTNLSTSGGSIHLDNLAGTQKFTTSGGSLHVSKLSGKVDGTTSGGSIHLEDSRDDIDLRTSGGSINANNCSGNLKLVTSGGSLNLSGLKGTTEATTSGGSVSAENIDGELKAHTSGGSVHMSGLTCSLETSTSGGNIDVAFAQLGKYVKINNSAGNVALTLPRNKGFDLDLSGEIANTKFDNFNGKIDEHQIRGKFNGGGVPVTVNAGSGRIKLDMK
jgi:hypothetical protein